MLRLSRAWSVMRNHIVTVKPKYGTSAMRIVTASLTLLFLPAPSGCRDTADLPEPSGRVGDLVAQLQSDDRQVAFGAATELGNMGPDAIAAIPALVDLATFDEAGSYRVYPGLAAGEALAKISPKAAVPYLVKALRQPHRRYWAARILGEFGSTARPAVSALVDALRTVKSAQTDDERNASAQAAAALANIRPEGLSALISQMGHDNAEVRTLAVWATPRGPDGRPAVEVLAWRLSDADNDIRRLAAIALGDIGPQANAALPFLRMAIEKERDLIVRFSMLGALESIEGTGDQ